MTTFLEAELGPAGERLVGSAREQPVRIHPRVGDDFLVVPADTYDRLAFVVEVASNLALVIADRTNDGELPETWTHPAWDWLIHLPVDDLDTFVGEVSAGILNAARTQSVDALRELLHAWQVTAEGWSDPLTRRVWSEPFRIEDYVEV